MSPFDFLTGFFTFRYARTRNGRLGCMLSIFPRCSMLAQLFRPALHVHHIRSGCCFLVCKYNLLTHELYRTVIIVWYLTVGHTWLVNYCQSPSVRDNSNCLSKSLNSIQINASDIEYFCWILKDFHALRLSACSVEFNIRCTRCIKRGRSGWVTGIINARLAWLPSDHFLWGNTFATCQNGLTQMTR